MAVVHYKRESHIDIISEKDQEEKESNSYSFFDLPFPIQVQIASHLDKIDTLNLASTCTEGWRLVKDQQMWRDKLWIRAKVLNVSLVPLSKKLPNCASMLIRDPLLVDNRKLYGILAPDSVTPDDKEGVNIENLLSKLNPPPTTGRQSFSELIESLLNTFLGNRNTQRDQSSDVFSKGLGAPTFMIFGPPETRTSKKLALSFIASKDSIFETVGLVKGKPGGVGGGVTVKYKSHLMNLLPIRRGRPRLLIKNNESLTYHPDVVEITTQTDGLICYMDGTCDCRNIRPSVDIKVGRTLHTYQLYSEDNRRLDLLELEIMLKLIPPNSSPPILILLAHSSGCDSYMDSSDEETSPDLSGYPCHVPSLFRKLLSDYDIPWAVCKVEVETLHGIQKGINWLLKRTLMMRSV